MGTIGDLLGIDLAAAFGQDTPEASDLDEAQEEAHAAEVPVNDDPLHAQMGQREQKRAAARGSKNPMQRVSTRVTRPSLPPLLPKRTLNPPVLALTLLLLAILILTTLDCTPLSPPSNTNCV